MSTDRKLRLAPLWWAGGWALTLLVVIGSLVPGAALPEFWLKDKFMHFAGYCALALWFAGMFERRRYPHVGILLMLLGLLIEIAQGAMGYGRAADWRDVAANALGIATAISLSYAGLGSWMLVIERRLGLS